MSSGKKKKEARTRAEAGSGRTAPPVRSWSIAHIALIILLGCLIYSNTLHAPFAFDDVSYIAENPALKDPRYFIDPALVERAIAARHIDPNFKSRTVGMFSFALNYTLHGLNVPGYHLVNILIHVLNGLLVYHLVLLTLRTRFFANRAGSVRAVRSGGLIALFAALLFVSHPVQTQAVTYLSQRFSSLATLFCLLSLVLYVLARRTVEGGGGVGNGNGGAGIRSWRFLAPYGASFVAAVLAMKTKEMAFTFPAIIALYEFLFLSGDKRRRLIYLLPLLLTMFIVPATVLAAREQYVDMARLSESLAVKEGANPALTYLLTQFRVIVTYFRLLVLPVDQNVDYDYPEYTTLFRAPVLLSLLFLLAVIGLAVVLYRRSTREEERNAAWLRLAAFGIFWFFLALMVESSIVPLKDLIFEHRLYLPSIGIFLSLVSAGEIVRSLLGPARAGRMTVFLVMLVGVWSVTAYARNEIWGGTVRLWQDAVRKSPNKARPRLNLAGGLQKSGRTAEAIGEMKEAIRLDPRSPDAYRNLGLAYIQEGDYAAALPIVQNAVAVDEKDATLHGNLGLVYQKLDRLSEAEKELLTAIKLERDLASAYSNLAIVYLKQKRLPEALAAITEAVRIEPENVHYHFNCGNAYAMNERYPEAVEEYRKVLAMDPSYPNGRQFLEHTLKRIQK